jgi:hypothetical protein
MNAISTPTKHHSQKMDPPPWGMFALKQEILTKILKISINEKM